MWGDRRLGCCSGLANRTIAVNDDHREAKIATPLLPDRVCIADWLLTCLMKKVMPARIGVKHSDEYGSQKPAQLH